MGRIYRSLARANERGLAGKCHGSLSPKTPAARVQYCHVVAVGPPLGERAIYSGGRL